MASSSAGPTSPPAAAGAEPPPDVAAAPPDVPALVPDVLSSSPQAASTAGVASAAAPTSPKRRSTSRLLSPCSLPASCSLIIDSPVDDICLKSNTDILSIAPCGAHHSGRNDREIVATIANG